MQRAHRPAVKVPNPAPEAPPVTEPPKPAPEAPSVTEPPKPAPEARPAVLTVSVAQQTEESIGVDQGPSVTQRGSAGPGQNDDPLTNPGLPVGLDWGLTIDSTSLTMDMELDLQRRRNSCPDVRAKSVVSHRESLVNWHKDSVYSSRRGTLYETRPSGRDTSLAPREAPLALMFTDIQDSTSLWESLQSRMDPMINLHHEIIRRVISKNEGYEVKTIGDAFMVAFKVVTKPPPLSRPPQHPQLPVHDFPLQPPASPVPSLRQLQHQHQQAPQPPGTDVVACWGGGETFIPEGLE